MANSDPPVSIPPVSNNTLTITATLKPGQSRISGNVIVVDATGKKLKLIVTRGDTRFETPIDEGKWKLEIVEVT
jgi:hypothetical protein